MLSPQIVCVYISVGVCVQKTYYRVALLTRDLQHVLLKHPIPPNHQDHLLKFLLRQTLVIFKSAL